MLFWQRMWPGLKDGSITLTFRRWKRPQVVAGRPYRVGVGRIRVDSVEVVDPEAIPDSEARKAGFDDAVELRASLVGDGALDVYRVAFEFLTEQDPRDALAGRTELSDDELADVRARLARLDEAAAKSHGAWTLKTLEIIERLPDTRAGDLAAELGRNKPDFKKDGRKLKNLGLTTSVRGVIGYRLSPRGAAVLKALRRG